MNNQFNWIRVLIQISQRIDRCTDTIGNVISWLVILTISVGFYNVVMRYLGRLIGLSLSSNALIELQWYLFSTLFCLGFAYILKHSGNVRVDFLYVNWTEKQRAWVDLFGTLLFLLPFCILGLWVSWHPVLQSWGQLPDGSWGNWELSPDANGLPRAPIKSMILVAFFTLLIQGVSQAIKYIAVIQGYTQIVQILQDDVERPPIE
jgi:TRAP-type mannitol/chloroaromatic compound transport system permease small subunit